MKNGAIIGGVVTVATAMAVIVFLQTSNDSKTGVKVGVKEASASCTKPGLDCMPEITFVSLDGEAITPEVLKGKVVMVNFWATWCGPCRKEIPALSKVYARYKDEGFVLLGVLNEDANQVTVEKFAKETGLNYPIIRVDQTILDMFEWPANLPTTFLYDRRGKLRLERLGALRENDLDKRVSELLAEPAPLAVK